MMTTNDHACLGRVDNLYDLEEGTMLGNIYGFTRGCL